MEILGSFLSYLNASQLITAGKKEQELEDVKAQKEAEQIIDVAGTVSPSRSEQLQDDLTID